MPELAEPWTLGGHRLANRLVLAPLAGIGNWFVRLQAKRYGAGLVVSEMVSSFGLKYGDERTTREFLRIHPEEHPVSLQLFGHSPEAMRIAAAKVAEAGADIVDINMGCPVKKVCKTGAGAALLDDPDVAVAVARAAVEGGELPVTVKLRPGQRPGDESGVVLARRLVEEAGVAGIAFHPRHASQEHRGEADYGLAARVVEAVAPVPVIVSGGLRSDERVHEALRVTGAEAVMLARGSLGNPWRFERLLGRREGEPSVREVVDELRWVVDRAEEHLGVERAGRYLRKFYPWYEERLELASPQRRALLDAPTTDAVRHVLDELLASEAFATLPRPSRPMQGFRSMPRNVVLTSEGLADLKAQLEHLSGDGRREVADRIKEAREFGDISENSEYDDAKNEQAMLEKQIAELEETLRSATVIDASDVNTDVVSVANVVEVTDRATGKTARYKIVGSAEANPSENKLSNESPVGKALLGRRAGDVVSVAVPRGPARELEITKIASA